MYLIKNFRNYIPLLAMGFIITFFAWHGLTETFVIILPFVFVPAMNAVSVILNTHKLKPGRQMYISILFSYALQFMLMLVLLKGSDDMGLAIIQCYYIFLCVVDAIMLVYPWIIYQIKK